MGKLAHLYHLIHPIRSGKLACSCPICLTVWWSANLEMH